jgi:hypothetical protein
LIGVAASVHSKESPKNPPVSKEVPDPAAKPPQPKPSYRWYELEFLVPFRDMVLLLGFAAFETGVFLLPRVGTQLGLMTTGAGLVYASWRILRS